MYQVRSREEWFFDDSTFVRETKPLVLCFETIPSSTNQCHSVNNSMTTQLLQFPPGLRAKIRMCNDTETGASAWSGGRARFISQRACVMITSFLAYALLLQDGGLPNS